MKYLTLTALLLASAFSHVASAQSDHFVKWSIGPGLSVNFFKYLEFDVNLLRKYITLNGAIVDDVNALIPATGSCFQLTGGGISCTFSAANRNFDIDTDANLSGSLKEKDSNGKIMGSALIQIVSLQ